MNKYLKLNKFARINSLGLLLTLAVCSCSGGSGTSSGGGVSTPATSGNLEIDAVATVPVLAEQATTSVIYLHNTGDTAIDSISYTVDNNDALDSDGFRVDANSCASLTGHSSCALKFTTPRLSTQGANVHGSALLKASYRQNGAPAMAQQLINYTLLPAPATLAAMTDVNLQAYQFGTIYLYAKNGNYNLESMTASIPELTETNRSSQVLDAPQVVAVEILATNIDKPQSVKLDLQYQNQQSQTNTLQSIVTATPYANGAYLTAGQVPVINTATGTSGQMQVYNSGNAAATLGNISADNGITILATGSNRCVSAASLAAHNSCTVYFTVPQAANNGTLSVAYDASGNLQQQVVWYNGVDQALLQMVVNPASVIAYKNGATAPITVTLQNIGGYDITALTVLAGTNTNGGSAATTTSTALSCLASDGTTDTGTTATVGGSCSYAITILDAVTEANKNMLLGISGSYTGSAGAATYSRKALLGYTTSPPAVTITPVADWLTMMGNAFPIIASIQGGPSTVTPTVSNLTGATGFTTPSSCALNQATAESCVFYVNGFSASTGYAYWDPTNEANSVNINYAYSYTNIGLNVTATGTGTTINGGASPLAITINSGKVYTPKVYLAAPDEGATSESNTGITWGTNGTIANRFSGVNTDCLVDALTGLTWPKNGIIGFVNTGGSYVLDQPNYANTTAANNKLTHAQAEQAVVKTNNAVTKLCNYSDWRLPTINEMQSLVNYAENPTTYLNSELFDGIYSSYYRTSTVYNSTTHYNLYMTLGSANTTKTDTESINVLLVRGGLNN